MKTQSVLVLGNGPINMDISSEVNHFDRVVRFNFCSGFPEHLGEKCTDLWLSSRGKQAKKLAENFPKFNMENLQSVVLTEPAPNPFKQYLFKTIKRKGKIDFSNDIINNIENKHIVSRLDKQYRRDHLIDLLKLGKPDHKPICPSSGLLAIAHFIERGHKVTIAGFGFQGWKRHPWRLEKKKVSQWVERGNVCWLNLDSTPNC
ncbi:hypothetical protein L1286_06625 [Pseudoalteromonas sp. SMS1]|uniref:hypothetical protein n=1 Tax=Pseudoalteromonas sp. SMS1 TaxID=2908894 RepID=UPI001F280E90|nr:hypothetical protein [Pseudoalteromonas sp. SMS1]MCF2857136.1 hypothetical protein [Pseudoalteromonas sp. SMS1]